MCRFIYCEHIHLIRFSNVSIHTNKLDIYDIKYFVYLVAIVTSSGYVSVVNKITNMRVSNALIKFDQINGGL